MDCSLPGSSVHGIFQVRILKWVAISFSRGSSWTVVLEETLESPLDSKEIKPVYPKGNQPWIFIGRTDAEAEAAILWPPDAESWLIGKDTDAGKDWGQEEKGATEDEMVRWHHQLHGHEFEQATGVGNGQGSLVCCSSWIHKESDTTKLNWLNSIYSYYKLLAVFPMLYSISL